MGLSGMITPLASVRSRKWLVSWVFDFGALVWQIARTAVCNGDTNGQVHEVVKEPAMFSPLARPAYLTFLCGLIALGSTAAEAAGIGVHLRIHAQNIPRAVAGGHNPHIEVGAGPQAPSRPHLNTRSIQIDGAGESTANRLPN
jgi:hypothetical protein